MQFYLNQVHGGSLNTDKIVEQFIGSINKIRPVQKNGFEKLLSNLKIFRREEVNLLNLVLPSTSFKGSKLENVTAIEILLPTEDFSSVIVGNSCSKNVAAGTKLNNCLGLLTPSIRFTIHDVNGSIKRLTGFKTKKVQAI